MGGKGGSSFDMNAYMQMQQQQMQQQEAMMRQMMEAMAGMMSPMEMPEESSINEDYLSNQEEQKRQQGIQDRDQLYSEYLDAVDKATNYVNQQIDQERSNADLLGVKYDLTDDMKNQRISDYFASIWGAGQQQQLEDLFGKWGNPEGFDDWLIVRGDAANVKPQEEGKMTEVQGATNRPSTLPTLEDEEDDLLGTSKKKTSTVLGV